MSLTSLGVVTFAAFLLVGVVMPTVSFLRLRKERDSLTEFHGRRRIASIFFTEVLIWIAVVLVAAFVVMMLLFISLYTTGHAAVTRGINVEPEVPPLLIVLCLASPVGLAIFGLVLHNFTSEKLFRGLGDSEHPLSLSGRKRK
jgi:hypothetical protein